MIQQRSKIPVKDLIIKKIAIKLRISESIVKEVVDDQFKMATKAMATNNSVEIAGFGKFTFLPKAAERIVKKYEEILEKKLNGEDVPNTKEIEELRADINYLNQKIASVKDRANSRRLEECDN